MIHEFRLSPLGKGGISCDQGGAFVGAVPMLVRTHKHGRDEWRPRDCDVLSKEMSAQYGLPVDMSSKTGGLRAIANAFNDGDMARAQVATLLLRMPNPPSLSKGAPSRQEMIKLAGELHWSGVLKADWDPDQHPRWPAHAPDSQGGRFAPKGDDPAAGQSAGATSARPGRWSHPKRGAHQRRLVRALAPSMPMNSPSSITKPTVAGIIRPPCLIETHPKASALTKRRRKEPCRARRADPSSTSDRWSPPARSRKRRRPVFSGPWRCRPVASRRARSPARYRA
jgi:hypothetical protein